MLPAKLEADIEGLRSEGQEIDVIHDGSRYLVVIKAFRLPDGAFDTSKTDVMIMADYQYPMSRLDMYWTDPPVRLKSGAMPQAAEHFESHGGRNWQRWSWHYPTWDPSKHNLRTHLEVFCDRLSRPQ